MKVLLSIKPEFAEKIVNGIKKFEYRKSIFKETGVVAIVVYVTKPCGKVIGEFSIEDIIMESPSELWNKTEKYAGIKRQYFNEYFKNREYGFAIKIKDFVPYKHPLSLEEYNPNIKVAPQSFCYIRE